MSMRHSFNYPVTEEDKYIGWFFLAAKVFDRTKSGYVVIHYKLIDSEGSVFRKSENLEYFYFETNEKFDMLNTLIELDEQCKLDGTFWSVFAFRKNLSKEYGFIKDEDEVTRISARMENISPQMIEATEQAKRIKELL